MINSHYVPKLILRKFSLPNKTLCLYNLKTGVFNENVSIEHAYAIEDYYDSETEKKLNERIESQFGNFLAKYILKEDEKIVLRPDKLKLIKKFLLVSLMRVYDEAFMEKERSFYPTLKENAKRYCSDNNIEYCEEAFESPFEEKQIEGETTYDYWLRTLNVILDTDGTPEQIKKHPKKTYPAHRWASIVKAAYLGFWDAPNDRDEFVVTDIGMTSENEKGWNEITNHNHKKMDWLGTQIDNVKTQEEMKEILGTMQAVSYFHENFQMFPISSRRMIVLISPFFKFRYMSKKKGVSVPPLDYITHLNNEELFSPNGNFYKNAPRGYNNIDYHEDDRYIYDVKTLSNNEIRYCNALFMDRIDEYLGFSSLEKAVGSIIKYKKLNSGPFIRPRKDYTPLYSIIKKGIWEI